MRKGPLLSVKCWLGWCGMVQRSNDTHLWGECERCGKVAGLITREAVWRYIQAEERHEAFLASRVRNEQSTPASMKSKD